MATSDASYCSGHRLDIEDLQKRLERSKADVKRLEEALQFINSNPGIVSLINVI